MHYFKYRKKALHCENVMLSDLAYLYGTPLYVYSQRTMLEHLNKLKRAFDSLDTLICYSVKVNSNLSLLKLMTRNGAGLDIVSGGELFRAKKIKCSPKKIVYASVGKTDREINDAIKYGILMFNVESLPELKRINRIAGLLKKKCKIALRFNPDVDAGTHKYITTGKKENKFGMSSGLVKKIILDNARYPNLKFLGIHMHIGSQITQSQPYVTAIKRAQKLIIFLRSKGVEITYLNIGGGLGIVYDKEKPQTARDFAKKVVPILKKLKIKVILEPGRFIVGNAGVLLTRVTYVKENRNQNFIIVDAAMNDLIRPSLYTAYHNIIPLVRPAFKRGQSKKLSDVVGPICESGDFLGKDRDLEVSRGDLLAVMGAGAYGFTMSSNYNSRPRVAEVLVYSNKSRVIRCRETYADLIEKEIQI